MASSTIKLTNRIFKAGDTMNVTGIVILSGYISGSTKDLCFWLPVNRQIMASSYNCTEITANIRGVSGGYLVQKESGNIVSLYNVLTELRGGGIFFRARATTAFSEKNNSPISVDIGTIKGTFA